MSTRTRRIAPEEIPAVSLLAARIWNECYASIISSEQITYMLGKMFGERLIGEELRAGVVWEYIIFNETIAGFLACSLDRPSSTLRLHKLYLLSEFRGRGLAQETLRSIADQARQQHATSVSLTVNKRNERALRAYERAGFKIVDDVVTDIGQGFVMDDYVMRLNLEIARC